MSAIHESKSGFDSSRPAPGEASLLLAELQHRVANELASAIAAMRLARNAGLDGPRLDLFDQAIARMEGFGKVHGVLAMRPSRTIDIAACLHRLCRGLVSGRDGLDGTRINLSVSTPPLPNGPGYRLLLIASELVFNGIRHALVDRAGHLSISVDAMDDQVHLVVIDDGEGIRKNANSSGTGLGTGIVDELVRGGGGRIKCNTSASGTHFHVSLPLSGPSPVDWILLEYVA